MESKEVIVYNLKLNELEVTFATLFKKVRYGQFCSLQFKDKKSQKIILEMGPYLYLGEL